MIIAFRADASLDIGTGHVMRCLTLAKEFKKAGDECLFICRAHEGNLISYLESEQMEVITLPVSEPIENVTAPLSHLNHGSWLGVSWQLDANETLHSIIDRAIDCLVVDHYALDVNWEKMVGEKVNNIFVIDDLADRNHECFALLDQNFGREENDYNEFLPSECLKLIGPSFALLRAEFLELRADSLRLRSEFKLKKILINLGGVDKNDFTSQIINGLTGTDLDHAVKITVVLGSTNPNRLKVEQSAKASPYDISLKVGVTNMAEIMASCDLAIGAAGSTTWERFSLGVPSILLSIAENQNSALNALSTSGCIYKLSVITMQDDLKRFFEQIDIAGQLLKLSIKGRELCDALGVVHIRKIIRSQCEGQS
jgi:UDP-2,4-diacetamido-2,4,6-trideoxy-beta-L-altropyranose hydrolase